MKSMESYESKYAANDEKKTDLSKSLRDGMQIFSKYVDSDGKSFCGEE